MKKRYIKPTLISILSLTENNLLDFASKSSIDGDKKTIMPDETPDGGEADGAAAKGYNAWTTWEE